MNHGQHDHHGHHQNKQDPAGGVTDPVCGMQVDPATAVSAEHDGKTYHFCCDGCRDSFVGNPDKYLSQTPFVLPLRPQAAAPTAPVAKGTIYTCPMHPAVRQEGPGSCPICGMALEPELPSATSEPNQELDDMTRRFWVATALAVPVFAIAMGGMQFGFGGTWSQWLQLALATPAVWWAGWPFFERGWASIRNRSPNMFTLIAMGVGIAWLYSVVATAAPGIFPMTVMEMDGSVPVYFEAAAVIVALALLGQVLELHARERTSGAIRALLDLNPKSARRIRHDGTDEDVPLEQVQRGDRLRVRPGEAVPVDGIVDDGNATLDESMVTGESLPVMRERGRTWPGDADVDHGGRRQGSAGGRACPRCRGTGAP